MTERCGVTTPVMGPATATIHPATDTASAMNTDYGIVPTSPVNPGDRDTTAPTTDGIDTRYPATATDGCCFATTNFSCHW